VTGSELAETPKATVTFVKVAEGAAKLVFLFLIKKNYKVKKTGFDGLARFFADDRGARPLYLHTCGSTGGWFFLKTDMCAKAKGKGRSFRFPHFSMNLICAYRKFWLLPRGTEGVWE
jgi:hypothetical protein